MTEDRCAELLKTDMKFPLHEAARVGDSPNVIDHLIFRCHFNVNSKNGGGNTPLQLAAISLLNSGAEVNSKNVGGNTPLHCTASHGHTSTVEHLLNRAAEVNLKNGGGNTPLHYAAWNGHTKTVEHLLSKGAEINGGCCWLDTTTFG